MEYWTCGGVEIEQAHSVLHVVKTLASTFRRVICRKSSAATTIALLHIVYVCIGGTVSCSGPVVALNLSHRSRFCAFCRGLRGHVRRVMSLKLGRN